MLRFFVGDRVVATEAYMGLPSGSVGTVVAEDGPGIGVDFDDWTNGHNCNGAARNKHGWWIMGSCLALVPEEDLQPPPECFEELFGPSGGERCG